ncbi:MAG: hypothetical protein KA319_00720 [Ferruginibacter sp.]|nr:hypothetical protein [Ferruginibacter sp.]
MKKHFFFFCLIIFCSSINAQQNALVQNKKTIQLKLKNWIASFNNFNFSDFIKIDTLGFYNSDSTDVEFDMELFKDLRPMFSQSKNKRFIIDAFSNQMGPEKKGNKYYTNADDGGYVDIWDLKEKKRYPIFYNSFSNWVQDSFWLTDSTFVLGCIDNFELGKRQPFIFIGNFYSKTMICFRNSNKNYLQKKKGYIINTPVPIVY